MRRRRFFQTAMVAGLSGGLRRNPVVAGPTGVSSTKSSIPKKPRIMFYHDGRHPLIYMYEPPMQKEEYESAVDELLGTPIEALMFTMGDGRTVLHDTKVGELWGDHIKKWPHLIFRRAYQNAKALIAAGHDPLRVVCDRAKAKGMLIYPVLLVQQGTGKRGEDTRTSEFRLNNRHLEIGAGGGVDPNFPGFKGLDFKHKEVRDERFALIEETVNRYPVDGFELQLNYMPYYFRPDEVDSGRQIMTAWIKRIYQAVKDSGASRELAIRIPSSVEGCYSIGLDVREWIQQGIVDVLIAETRGGVDQMADYRPLVAAAKGSKSRIHASLRSTVDSDRLHESTIAITRAAACNLWDQGVQGLYLNQWFSNWPYQSSFYEKVRELPYPEVMAPRDKYYFVPTVTGRYPDRPGRQLPADLKVNQPVQVEFRISDDLARWGNVGRVHEVLLRMRLVNTTELDSIEFRLNGKSLPGSSLRKINEMYKMKGPGFRVSGYWFIYQLDPEHWPKKGRNIVEVRVLKRDRDITPQLTLRNVELEVKYLLGKNLGRAADPDLGAQAFGTDS